MGAATADAFAALRLARLRALLRSPLTDDQLMRELRAAKLDPDQADPSVETLVHALLPHRYVLHSHADAILTLTNTPDGAARAAQLPGVMVIDYAMPGVDLAAAFVTAWTDHGNDSVHGAVVLQHGLFTFADTAQEALDRHLAIVSTARELAGCTPAAHADTDAPRLLPNDGASARMPALRKELSERAGAPFILQRDASAQVAAFVCDPRLLAASQRGPVTPDHVIWTKRTALIGTDIAQYAADYTAYVQRNAARRERTLLELDGAPRVILDPELGLLTAGPDARAAARAADIYRHTMDVIACAERNGGYQPASEGHVFDLEYWQPQQDKLSRGVTHRPLDGQIALVTGAASGIGHACASAFLEAGAAVVGWDLSDDVAGTFNTPAWLGQRVDVTDTQAMKRALADAVAHFGGLDILLVSAGIFPKSADLADLDMDTWRRTMRVNVDSVAELYGLTFPLLEEAWDGGRVVVIASKNVPAPGRGAAAYSSSKAALTQVSRVAALEWAGSGIRVNMIHPDAVFDTGLWTPELLATRAAHYGLSVEEYKRRNLLHTEVSSTTVAALALAMATKPFSATTGAQVATDGGSDRTI